MYHAFISLVSDSETDGDLHLIESLSHALSYLLGLNNGHLNRVENIPGKLKCLFIYFLFITNNLLNFFMYLNANKDFYIIIFGIICTFFVYEQFFI